MDYPPNPRRAAPRAWGPAARDLGTGWAAGLPGGPCPGPQEERECLKIQNICVWTFVDFGRHKAPEHKAPPWRPLCVIYMSLSPDPRLFAPSIKARFPPETYALVGQQVTLECFAFGK